MQIWVNERTDELAARLVEAQPTLETESFRWVSPLAGSKYAEYRDGDFLRHIGRGDLGDELKRFWPARGPVWDGLATFRREGVSSDSVLLVEGKSHVAELRGSGCQATGDSLVRIEEAFARTRRNVHSTAGGSAWTGPLYQSANRLAHAHWLRETCGLDAWLVHLLFVDDPTWAAERRADASMWKAAVDNANDELGLDGADFPWAFHMALPGRDREELTHREDAPG